MQRLFEAGLTVLLMATVVVPAHANPTSEQPVVNRSTNAPTTQPKVEAKSAQFTRTNEPVKEETPKLSERDRLVLERRLQQIIPPQQ